MPRRRSARKMPSPRRVPVEPLEFRVLFTATVHNDSFDVTGLTALRADADFSSITGAGIGIAVLDSGVDAANPDLTGQVVGYYNAVEDAVPTTAPTAAGAVDNDGHGTHVSGIAASADPDIGVAYGAHLVDVKVIADDNEQQLSGDPILRGLQFVADYAANYNIKVVNMSLGEASQTGGINSDTTPAADDVSREIGVLEGMGITVVAASGNSYANDPTPGESYPADVSTIGVASTWADTGVGYDFADSISYGTPEDTWAAVEASAAPDRFSATSQRSTLANQVVAPGVDIYSDWNGSSTDDSGSDLLHNTLSGTSMATPFVSGVVALMQQAALTYGGRYITDPEQVLDIIKATADRITDANVADNGRVQISDGELVSDTVQNLPETGDTFDRVNVLRAIEAVKALFTGTVSNADIDDTTATATAVSDLDGTAILTESGNIGTDGLNDVGADDVDLYAVTLTSAGALTADLSAGGSDTFTADVRVVDANGNQIAASVGTSSSGYPTVTAGTATDPLAIGTYYVGVSSAGNGAYTITGSGGDQTGATGGTGDYQLQLTLSNPDPNGVVQGAVAVDLTDPNTTLADDSVANVYSGVLGSDPPPTGGTDRVSVPNGDVDMFAVVAPDTGTLTASVNATNYGFSGSDSFLEAFTEDAAGHVTVVGSNGTASDAASNSTLAFPVTLGQTYYVAVTVYDNRTFSPTDPFDRVAGSTATQTDYDLYLAFNNGNTFGTALQPFHAAVDTPVSGDIGSTVTGMGANGGFKYVDWYVYQPGSGLLDLSATATSSGFSPNVQLWTLTTNSDGTVGITQVASVTGSGQNLITPVTYGTPVYVSVTGAGNTNFNWYSLGSGTGGETGTYTLASSILSVGSAAAKAVNDNSIDNGTPGTITTAAAVSGDIGMDGGFVAGASDDDLYAFTPTATGAYDIRTGTSQEGSADTYLRLFTADGAQLASNDNADSTSTASFIRADLTAGVTYYVGVSGSGNSAYDPVTGAGATDATKTGLYTLSVARATLPAISIASPAPVAPTAAGASLTFVVSLDQPASADVTVGYATADGTALAGTDYTATSGTLTIAANTTSATITVPVLVDTSANGTLTFALNLTSPSANALLDGGQATGSITDLPVSQLPFSNGHRATYQDAAGRNVTVTLSGPGSGVVSVVGDNADEVTIATTGTTARTRLSIQPAGKTTTIDGLDVTGSLAALAAAAVDLAGDLTVTGTIGSLVLAGATGSHTLSIEGSAATGSLRLGDVSGLTVDTAEPLASLSATEWANPTGSASILAPSLKSLAVSGTFDGDVTVAKTLQAARIGGAVAGGVWTVSGSVGTMALGSTTTGWSLSVAGAVNALTVNGAMSGQVGAASIRSMRVGSNLSNAQLFLTAANANDLNTLTVGGSIADSAIRATGSIGTVRAGSVTGSTLFAGVDSSLTALPTTAADFVADATIKSFTAGAFADSDVAAAALGRIAVRRVTTDNGGTPFGFAADTLASFTDTEPGAPAFRWTSKDPTSRLVFNGDLTARVLG